MRNTKFEQIAFVHVSYTLYKHLYEPYKIKIKKHISEAKPR